MTKANQLDSENPWPGLDAFQEDAADFFHGRHREAESLLAHVSDAAVTVLYGRSGLGKTSLLQAGLFPALRKNNFLPIYVRFDVSVGATPLTQQLTQSVHSSIQADVIDATRSSDRESLWEYLHRGDLELWSQMNYELTPVIVIDQFEELFTLGERLPRHVEEFKNDFGDLVENRIPADIAARIEASEAVAAQLHLRSRNYKIVISMREDLLPDLEEWRRLIPALGYSRVRLLPMNVSDALTVVRKPVTELMSQEFARRVVAVVAGDKVHNGPSNGLQDDDTAAEEINAREIEPALLSLFCRELNNKRKHLGREYFNEDLIEDDGRDILTKFYSDCLDGLRPEVAKFVESELITTKGFRNSYAREDAVPSRITDDELARLISSRLLRLEDRHGTQRIELTHDVLTGVVREHRDRRQTDAEKSELASRLESQQRRARKRLTTQWTAGVSAVGTVLGLLALVFAMNSSMRIDEARQQAIVLSRDTAGLQLALEGQQALAGARGGDNARAIQQILAAYELVPERTEGALMDAVFAVRGELSSFRTVENVTATASDSDGEVVVTGTMQGTAQVWDVTSGELAAALSPLEGLSSPVSAVAVGPAGNQYAVGHADGRLQIWNVVAGTLVSSSGTGSKGPIASLAFSPDGQRIAVVYESGRVWFGNAATGELEGSTSVGDTDTVTSVTFSPDGKWIAFGRADGGVQLWDRSAGRPVGQLLDGQQRAVTAVAFGPTGQWVASGSADGAVRLWDLTEHTSIAEFVGHNGQVTSISFSPDGRRIVSSSDDGTVRLWDTRSGQSIGSPIDGGNGAVLSATFGQGEREIVSGNRNGVVQVWPGPTVWKSELCGELTSNISRNQWRKWVPPQIGYIEICPGLPIPSGD